MGGSEMICEHCNKIMRFGVILDNYQELLFCPVCGRLKVISITEEENDTQERLQSRTKDETEESDRGENN